MEHSDIERVITTYMKDALKGHTRLSLLYGGFRDFAQKKVLAIAKLAYVAGIKQILDIPAIRASGN